MAALTGDAESPANAPPRRQSVAIDVIEFVLKALDSFLRMIGVRGQEMPKPPVASHQTAAPLVGIGEVLRPVQPSAGQPKADAFDAFDEPKPKPVGEPSAPAATDAGSSPSTEKKQSK